MATPPHSPTSFFPFPKPSQNSGQISRSHLGGGGHGGTSPLFFWWRVCGGTSPRQRLRGGAAGARSCESEGAAGVFLGHRAPRRPERRAGRTSGKFQAAAEGSLRRRITPGGSRVGVGRARDSSGGAASCSAGDVRAGPGVGGDGVMATL
jgi:hypothetical protein